MVISVGVLGGIVSHVHPEVPLEVPDLMDTFGARPNYRLSRREPGGGDVERAECVCVCVCVFVNVCVCA